MLTIDKRAQGHATNAFVTTETVDALATKLIGIVGDRRMTVMRRYLGDHGGTPRLTTGLRLNRQGFGDPVNHRPGNGVSISLTPGIEGVGFSVQRDSETEAEVRERYHHPERHFLSRREDIVYVELRGWPGRPHSEDSIRIERWNQHGVGEEIIVAFDDIDMINELFWDVTSSKERQVCMWDEFCKAHGMHAEHPDHTHSTRCVLRQSTRAEDLAVLAHLAALAETSEIDKPV